MTKAQYDPEASKAWSEEAESVFGPVVQKIRDNQPIQDADNTANLYFFDNARLLAFHWDGQEEHQVEVSHGGDHEPARWFFPYPTFARLLNTDVFANMSSTYLGVLGEFQATCELWIKMKEDAR